MLSYETRVAAEVVLFASKDRRSRNYLHLGDRLLGLDEGVHPEPIPPSRAIQHGTGLDHRRDDGCPSGSQVAAIAHRRKAATSGSDRRYIDAVPNHCLTATNAPSARSAVLTHSRNGTRHVRLLPALRTPTDRGQSPVLLRPLRRRNPESAVLPVTPLFLEKADDKGPGPPAGGGHPGDVAAR